ncbi:MAG TPA: hypothetical protein VLT33_27105 [Labilithrix sp.]|nr:hypothetical protein [Labilithrix sp.]
MRALLALTSALMLTVACGGEAGTVGPAPGGSSGSGTSSGGSGSGSEDPSGPRLTLALRGSIEPVAHADAFASQTPSRQIVAVKSLWLYTSASDPSPVKVLDLGARSVETDLVTGMTSEIGTVALRSLPAGTYTLAKVGTAYVRYSVASRMHAALTADGRYDNVQALSDGAVIDGQTHQKGWYRYQFSVGATPYGVLEGENAPVPQLPAGGGIALDSSGAESFYVFPTLVVIDPTVTSDQRVVCEVNVHESFRWQDQALAGYAARVYDTTPTSFEPVMAFGANAFSLKLEAK